MAAKRRLFELEGLKFEIGRLKIHVTGEEAEQQLKTALADEFTRALAPVTHVLHPQLGEGAAPAQPAATVVATAPEKRSPRRGGRLRAAANAPQAAEAAALEWKPDIQKCGNPTPSWSTAEKGMWLLHCYSKDNGGTASEPKGLSLPIIVATYNKHFPHTKIIMIRNVYRDFNRYAGGDRPKITADRGKTPAVWYLTGAGVAAVEELTKKAAPSLVTGAA